MIGRHFFLAIFGTCGKISCRLAFCENKVDSPRAVQFGNMARFNMDTPYYSLHGCLGYVWNMAVGHKLDIYGKYISRVQGTDDTLTIGDKFEADDMDLNTGAAKGKGDLLRASHEFRAELGQACWQGVLHRACAIGKSQSLISCLPFVLNSR